MQSTDVLLVSFQSSGAALSTSHLEVGRERWVGAFGFLMSKHIFQHFRRWGAKVLAVHALCRTRSADRDAVLVRVVLTSPVQSQAAAVFYLERIVLGSLLPVCRTVLGGRHFID